MKTSAAGITLLKEFEGCRLLAYKDVAGILTIGVGHTGPEVKEGLTITQEAADELLKFDLSKFERCVNIHVRVPLSQQQYDALVCFVYNVGEKSLKGSTLLKKLNKRDYQGAADSFLVWDKARVKGVLRSVTGLTRRRSRERALFLTGL